MIDAVEKTISERNKALNSGNLSLANTLEEELKRFNVTLEDLKHGTKWTIN